MLDIAVIGGGAAGLCSAISAARCRRELNITVFERMDRVGRKLSLTGNGRCNITNKNLSADNFHGADKAFIRSIFSKVSHADITEFFYSLGVPFISEEDGRQYPASLQAPSVTDALRFECQKLGVKLRCDCQVNEIKKTDGGFVLICEKETVDTRSVILAAGGLAGGVRLGCDGSGYKLARSLGHSTTSLFPAIVQQKTENSVVRQLKGIKVNCTATLLNKLEPIRSEYGEVLFCDYGLSGPPVLQLSSGAAEGFEISLDLMPFTDEKQLSDMLCERVERFGERPLAEFFTGMLNKRLGQVIIKELGCSLDSLSRSLTARDIERLAKALKEFRFLITGNGGHLGAQATLGGLCTGEFYPDTLESAKLPGLFAAGEILDVCGDCGGYNLSFAWACGIICGQSAAIRAAGRR